MAALAAPIREVRSLVGPGPGGAPSADPAMLLADARDALTDVKARAERSWGPAGAGWSGLAADRAAQFVAATAETAGALAQRAEQLTTRVGTATAAVARARARLQAIIEDFEARAAALEPHLDTPGAAEELLAQAQRSLSDAIGVIDDLRHELDRQARSLVAPPAEPPAPHAQRTSSSGPLPGFALTDFVADSPQAAASAADPDAFGSGVEVHLPDGSTVTAPNPVAAGAVRNALTQLGVPYQWGGITPGRGLDCSGLTQWAYSEAGLTIPRLAQEQDVGAAIEPGGLLPGDLAVWDGHVAMIVGNGMMIEAGDPVQLSAVRTTNAGQGFHGFFRPTA